MTEPVYTVKDAYGKPLSELTAPNGWEFTREFKVPECGDRFLSTTPALHISGIGSPSTQGPRLILRRAKRKRIIFEEIDRRYDIKIGEWVETDYSIFCLAENTLEHRKHVVYSRREEEF